MHKRYLANVQPNTEVDRFERKKQKDSMRCNTMGFKSSDLEPNTLKFTDHFPQVIAADFEHMANPSVPGLS